MTRYFVTKLQVEGFRGINNEADPLSLKFKPDAVNSIFAVNGIGKSSLFDALSYALHGDVPKLATLQTQERPQDYYANRFHSTGKATIELELQPDDGGRPIGITVSRSKTGVRSVSSSTGHAAPAAFLASLKEQFALLDYQTFARFIEESPLKRGRTFSALLGLSAYSSTRQALQAASETRTLNSDLDIKVLTTSIESAQREARQSQATILSSYEKIVGKALTDSSRLDDAAAGVAQALASVELLKSALARKRLDEIDFESLKSTIRAAEGGEKHQDLANTVAKISKLEALLAPDQAAIAVDQAALKRKVAERDTLLSSTRGELFKGLYDAASLLISCGEWSDEMQCPLCESTLEHSIKEHVERQGTQYASASAKINELGEYWDRSAWRAFVSAIESSDAIGIPLPERWYPELNATFSEGEFTELQLEHAIDWSTKLTQRAREELRIANAKRDEIQKELPESLVQLTEQVEHGRSFRDALNRYRQKQGEEADLQVKLDIRERWKSCITGASDSFSDAEAALSATKVAEIEDQYKEMFAFIMSVGDVVPELQREADSEDLHVQLADFHGQHKLSARALLSESFRNALAISVFLAAAMKHVGAPRFVVLDDVTSSFDSGHQYMLMELIRTKLQHPVNPDGLQFIVLSHDGLLEKYFDRLGGTTDWHHNKLQGSPPMGAVISQGADRLKGTIDKLLRAGQTSQAEPLIRQYLEFSLQAIIRKVNIPVPIDFAIKDTSKMTQNCLDAITDAIKLHKAANSLVLDSKQVTDLETVHVPAILGNWVSHYATGSTASFTAPLLQRIIKTIDDLAECFQYDDTSSGTAQRKWYKSLSRR
ncbi:AAA family ATPase [Bradyrhizobium sp. SZCCHNRI1073]|uniref:ATP-binding protein n=1 Tax=Bradyrhizobium sp. SZCCHNRI1073 TaxID=3057280 RepID=UPI00291654A0|nr:AAA family ATPase [Bradyrhizobium sp. SZCCHNRI1073]